MTDTRIIVDTSAIGRLSKKYARLVADLDAQVDITVNAIASKSERAFAASARSHGYTHVAEGVFSVKRGQHDIDIHTKAIDPESGYDYSLITRLGHRVKYIVPRTGKYLKFPYNGKILYRRRVKAWSPTVDWAREAMPEVRSIVRNESRNLTRRLVRRLS